MTEVEAEAAYLLVVALLALFFVLDRLDVVDAAGTCSRRGARRRGGRLMAAAVFVYHFEAHGGGAAGSACRESEWRGVATQRARKAGRGLDALIGGRAGSSFSTQTAA